MAVGIMFYNDGVDNAILFDAEGKIVFGDTDCDCCPAPADCTGQSPATDAQDTVTIAEAAGEDCSALCEGTGTIAANVPFSWAGSGVWYWQGTDDCKLHPLGGNNTVFVNVQCNAVTGKWQVALEWHAWYTAAISSGGYVDAPWLTLDGSNKFQGSGDIEVTDGSNTCTVTVTF